MQNLVEILSTKHTDLYKLYMANLASKIQLWSEVTVKFCTEKYIPVSKETASPLFDFFITELSS